MLYILFGKDKIGKKTVRNWLAKRFGLTIIPKYSVDTIKSWTLKYKNSNNEWIDLNSSIRFDSVEVESVRKKVMEYKQINSIRTNDCYMHRTDDQFVKLLQTTPTVDDFYYEVPKDINGKPKKIGYWIRHEHIETALKNINENFILVCVSGDVIKKIDEKRKQLEESGNQVANIKLVFISGSERESLDNDIKWDPSWAKHAGFYFENSFKFIKLNNRTCFKQNGDSEEFNFEEFKNMIDKQWILETHMLPTRISCFVVRPFSDHNNRDYNVNDLIYEELKTKIEDIRNDIIGKGGKARYIDFEKLDGNGNNIFSQIKNVLTKSQLVIIDLREHRQNCYYEYGYAQALVDMLYDDWGQGSGKYTIGLIGIVKEDSSYCEKQVISELDSELRSMWQDLSVEENKTRFDITQFAHYKYIAQVDVNYDSRKEVKIDICKPDGSEPTFEDKIRDIIRYEFNGVNALLEK